MLVSTSIDRSRPMTPERDDLWEQARTLTQQVVYMREANRLLSVLAAFSQMLGKHIEQNSQTPNSTKQWVASVHKVAREKADHTAAWLGDFEPQLAALVEQINERI